MTVSVLIPTVGRNKELIDAVQGLMKQTVLPNEIIVVDQNEPVFDEVDRYLKTNSRVKHIKNVPKGVVPNYNRCLQEASGDVVLFMDDDVIPDADLIEKHIRHYSKSEVEVPAKEVMPIGGVAGRIREARNGMQETSPCRKIGFYGRFSGRVVANFSANRECEVQFGQGANMSFLRSALLRIGGFDPRFDGNGYFFETDAGLRLRKAGYRMVFDPQAGLDHLISPRGGARIHDKSVHTFHFVKNGVRLYRRHSPLLGLPLYLAWLGFYSAAKSARNLNLSIFLKGLKGIWLGLKTPSS
jgi:GT2 family glycosyltransferase